MKGTICTCHFSYTFFKGRSLFMNSSVISKFWRFVLLFPPEVHALLVTHKTLPATLLGLKKNLKSKLMPKLFGSRKKRVSEHILRRKQHIKMDGLGYSCTSCCLEGSALLYKNIIVSTKLGLGMDLCFQ